MKFTKTETEYSMKSIRFLLLTITTMFIAIAVLLIVLGNSVYAHYHTYTFFYDHKVGIYITPSVLCVFLGMALLVVSVFGFVGSLKRSTCMVNFYAVILAVMFIFKLVVVCLAFTIDSDALLRSLHFPLTLLEDPEIMSEIQYLQSTLGCCGAYDYRDYLGVEFPANMSTTIVTKPNAEGDDMVAIVLPSSCCVNTEEQHCTRMWSTGCKAALVNMMVQNSTVIGVLGVSVMFINLLGVIFAVLLARCIRKMKSEKALMAWKVKEQMIMARQAEEMFKNEQEQNHVYIDHQASSMA